VTGLESLLPMVFTSGWASGVNAYATVLLLGLLGNMRGWTVSLRDSSAPTY